MNITLPQLPPGPWRMTRHNPFCVKAESPDRVIFDGFKGEEAAAVAAAAVPELLQALAALLMAYAPGCLASEATDPGNLHSSVQLSLAALRKAGCTLAP